MLIFLHICVYQKLSIYLIEFTKAFDNIHWENAHSYNIP